MEIETAQDLYFRELNTYEPQQKAQENRDYYADVKREKAEGESDEGRR